MTTCIISNTRVYKHFNDSSFPAEYHNYYGDGNPKTHPWSAPMDMEYNGMIRDRSALYLISSPACQYEWSVPHPYSQCDGSFTFSPINTAY